MTTRRSRTVKTEIVGDADELERELKRAKRAVRDAERQMESFGLGAEKSSRQTRSMTLSLGDLKKGAAATVGAIGLVIGALAGAGFAAFKLSGQASDLAEAQDAVRAVFGESATSILRWAETSALAFGQSERAALENATGIGDMIQTAGFLPDEAARMSMALVELASDMASLRNEDPTEMLGRIRSALAGEAEPLRQYAVDISAARVEQVALAMGLAETSKELDAQDKFLARYAIIQQDASRAAGNFKDTAAGQANQLRILGSQVENLSADFGEKLEPEVTETITAINEFLAQNDEELIEIFGTAVEGLGDAFDIARAAAEKYIDVINQVRGILGKEPLFEPDPREEALRAMSDEELNERQSILLDRIADVQDAIFASTVDTTHLDNTLTILNQMFDEISDIRAEREGFVPGVTNVGRGSTPPPPRFDIPPDDDDDGGGGAGRAPTAFTPADLDFINRTLAGLPEFTFANSDEAVAEFEQVQQAFDDTRETLRLTAARIGLDLADLDAAGLENTEQFAAMKGQLDAVRDTLKRIDLIEDLELDPFREQIEDLAEALREAKEVAEELAQAERDRATQNVHNLARAITDAANQGIDVSGALAEFNRQSRIAAGLPEQGSGTFVNAGGQTVVLQVTGDLNVDTADGGQIPAVDELLR